MYCMIEVAFDKKNEVNEAVNSLLYKKPMIVTKNTLQGDYADKYGVGVAIDNCYELEKRLQEFINSDFVTYSNNCDALLSSFISEQELFVNNVVSFVKSK